MTSGHFRARDGYLSGRTIFGVVALFAGALLLAVVVERARRPTGGAATTVPAARSPLKITRPSVTPPNRPNETNATSRLESTRSLDRGISQPASSSGQIKPASADPLESTSVRPNAPTPTAVSENHERTEPEPNLALRLPPAHEAVQAGDSSAVATALLSGAAVDERDGTRATPLLRAAWLGQITIVQLLLAQGAAVNATDSAGQTALHLAVTYDHPRVVDALLSAGADPNIRAHRNNDSPFFRAILHGSTKEALAMERRGATLSANDLKLLEAGAKVYPSTIGASLAALRHRRP
jgi:hypothetical protein